MPNRLRIALVVAIAIAVVVWLVLRKGDPSPARSAPATSVEPAATAPAPGAPPTTTAAPPPPRHVTRLASAQERRQVADRIASAQAAHAATHAPRPPSLPAATMDPNDPEGMKTTIRSAMKEAIPFLAECYDKAKLDEPETKVIANLTLTGDPDVGTLIDADQLVDGAQKPLPTGFDDCVRSTLQTLQLPPLAEGNLVKVTYPFVFSH
jgi:hypothetical protein